MWTIPKLSISADNLEPTTWESLECSSREMLLPATSQSAAPISEEVWALLGQREGSMRPGSKECWIRSRMLCLFVENVFAILELPSWVSPDWSLSEIRNRIRHSSFRCLKEGVRYFQYTRAGIKGGSRGVS